VILVSSIFYAFVDYNASMIMKSIRSIVADTATVVRNGEAQELLASEIVVGDLVQLSLGNRVPADLRLVDATSDLRFDRSLLTGESEPVAASINPTDENPLETKNLALSSTFVVQGSGTGVVFATGKGTCSVESWAMSLKQLYFCVS
jgi:sodium/potassium-transporting ATPase subunit alpha